MYLLNLKIVDNICGLCDDLHSTMYLLNPESSPSQTFARTEFTFHYVSIKSRLYVLAIEAVLNLHSTMYLLNHKAKVLSVTTLEFTFHYVSIKSRL